METLAAPRKKLLWGRRLKITVTTIMTNSSNFYRINNSIFLYWVHEGAQIAHLYMKYMVYTQEANVCLYLVSEKLI